MQSEFIFDNDLPWEDLDGGVKRKIMAYEPSLMMTKVAFEKGSVGVLHQHVHVQMAYVESGVFEVEVAGQKRTLKQGDAYYIPSNAVHGVVCLEAGILVDVFTPMRQDFLC
ncbi:MAG: cupin domain-containing protein [Spirosomaceae bacterium]|nr:cupin domain-containing protein [Spirosomataceae bacterium]